jgi:hypothetical protein
MTDEIELALGRIAATARLAGEANALLMALARKHEAAGRPSLGNYLRHAAGAMALRSEAIREDAALIAEQLGVPRA